MDRRTLCDSIGSDQGPSAWAGCTVVALIARFLDGAMPGS